MGCTLTSSWYRGDTQHEHVLSFCVIGGGAVYKHNVVNFPTWVGKMEEERMSSCDSGGKGGETVGVIGSLTFKKTAVLIVQGVVVGVVLFGRGWLRYHLIVKCSKLS